MRALLHRFGRRLAGFVRASGGNVALMTAATAPVVLGLAAVAVDEGTLYLERRQVQAATDLAAIMAAAEIDTAEAAARAVLRDQGLLARVSDGSETAGGDGEDPLAVVKGRYTADPTLTVEQRFVAGAEPANAVKVTFATTGTRHFSQRLFAPPRLSASAVASTEAHAAFSVGTRLLRLDGGIVNALLGGLTGSEIALDVMDYEALLDADVDLLTVLDTLALSLDLEAATYEDLLDTEIGINALATAIEAVPGLERGARNALSRLARQTAGADHGMFLLGDLVTLAPLADKQIGLRSPGLALKAGVLDLVQAAAVAAGGGHQLALDLGAGIPGLLEAQVELAIGEPPQNSAPFGVGEVGDTVHTAQTRLYVALKIGGEGVLRGLAVRLPIYLEVAHAQARLTDIACGSSGASATVAARPGVADLRVAGLDMHRFADFSSKPHFDDADIVRAPLIRVTGSARVAVEEQTATSLRFTAREIADGETKTVSTRDLVTSIASSLIEDLDLDVRILGLDLGLSGLVRLTVGNLLLAVAPAVDGVLNAVLDLLGVSVGQADVRVTGASCGQAVLVQ